MASCAGCGRGNWKFGADFFAQLFQCTNRACGAIWCSKCVKGWIFKSCPNCGNNVK